MKATAYNGILKVADLEGSGLEIEKALDTLDAHYTSVVYEDEPGSYLPAWLDAGDDLFVHEDAWRLLYGLGANLGWSEEWQRGLVFLLSMEPEADPGGKWASPEGDVLACVELLKYTGLHKRTGKRLTSKSADLRHSFRYQLVDWLEDSRPTMEQMQRAMDDDQDVKIVDCRFSTPFSARQWMKVMRGKYSAYSSHRKRGASIKRYLNKLYEAGDIWPARCGDLVPNYKDL